MATTPTPPPASPHANFNQSLYLTSLFSDCTIRCRDRTWRLHRAILAPRCDFFGRCLGGPFEESGSTVNMPDDDPAVLERLLQWLYLLEFPRREADHVGVWTADLSLYIMADKYHLPGLMDRARKSLIDTAVSLSDVRTQTDRFAAHVSDFTDMLQLLFVETPDREDVRSLRKDMVEITGPMVAHWVRHQSDLQDFMSSTPEFAVELIEELARPKTGDAGVHRGSSSRTSSGLGPLMEPWDKGNSSTSSLASQSGSPRKIHIPMNEDSEDEMD